MIYESGINYVSSAFYAKVIFFHFPSLADRLVYALLLQEIGPYFSLKAVILCFTMIRLRVDGKSIALSSIQHCQLQIGEETTWYFLALRLHDGPLTSNNYNIYSSCVILLSLCAENQLVALFLLLDYLISAKRPSYRAFNWHWFWHHIFNVLSRRVL